MRRFLASAGFPFLLCLVLAGASCAAYALQHPTGEDIGNGQILEAMRIAGWAVGPLVAVLSLIAILLLNGIRRMVKLRRVGLLHPVVPLLVFIPWLIFAWQLAGEPPFTPIARGVVAFVARPLLWGTLAATVFTLVCAIPLVVPAGRNARSRS